MSAPLTDTELRDKWLAGDLNDVRFEHMIYVGSKVTITDAKRWLREALADKDGTASLGDTDPYADHVYCTKCRECVTCNLCPCIDGHEHDAQR